jgi:hypothetical protein
MHLFHLSKTSTFKNKFSKTTQHSKTKSSSHAKRCLRYLHPLPPTSQPLIYISATVIFLLVVNSKSLLKRIDNHLSFHNRVPSPFFTFLLMSFSNHRTRASTTRKPIYHPIFSHQHLKPQPLLSTNNLQLH